VAGRSPSVLIKAPACEGPAVRSSAEEEHPAIATFHRNRRLEQKDVPVMFSGCCTFVEGDWKRNIFLSLSKDLDAVARRLLCGKRPLDAMQFAPLWCKINKKTPNNQNLTRRIAAHILNSLGTPVAQRERATLWGCTVIKGFGTITVTTRSAPGRNEPSIGFYFARSYLFIRLFCNYDGPVPAT